MNASEATGAVSKYDFHSFGRGERMTSLPLLADQHLVGGKLEVFRQADGLATIGHEDLGGSGPGGIPPRPIVPYTNSIWHR